MEERGLTLIELMIAVATLVIGIGAGVTAINTSRAAAADSNYLLRATTAMESEMDRLRAARELPASGSFSDAELRGIPGAVGQRRLAPVAAHLVKATLSVSWAAVTGKRRTVRLVSLIAAPRSP